jgi:single stranded DNA-binding protein
MRGLYVTVECVVGTEPRRSQYDGSPVVSFRAVTNDGWFDRQSQRWNEGHASWMSVSCFRDLARNVGSSVSKGDRLIVQGKLRIKEYQTQQGERRIVADLTADAVGHNLRHGTARFRLTKSPDSAEDRLREHADELSRVLAEEPRESVADLLAQRAAAEPAEDPLEDLEEFEEFDEEVEEDDEGDEQAHAAGERELATAARR